MENKDLVKIKGFFVDLNDVTSAIKKISSVTDAITTVYTHNNINYLCSYIITNQNITKEQLREKLNNFLDYYMIPAYIIFLNNFPHTSQGRIDEQNLPLPTDFDIIKDESVVAPQEDDIVNSHLIAELKNYEKITSSNKIENIIGISKKNIGDVLLTGVITKIGAYIIDSYIKRESGIIYCLVHDKTETPATQRLKNNLHEYFGDKYDLDIGTRIRVIQGRVGEYEMGLTEEEYDALGSQVNTVIHCAEFLQKKDEEEKVKGTKKITDFCEKFNLKLIHLSQSTIPNNISNSEQKLYIGQNLKDVKTKVILENEKIVLDFLKNNQKVYIIRIDKNKIKNYENTAINILEISKFYNKKFSIFDLSKNNSEFTQEFIKNFTD